MCDRFSTATAFAMPFPEAMRCALQRRGLRRAAHYTAVFGGTVNLSDDPGLSGMKEVLVKVLREDAPDEEPVDAMIAALEEVSVDE